MRNQLENYPITVDELSKLEELLFVHTIIQYLNKNGVVGIFEDDETAQIIQIIEQINQNAEVA